MQIISLPDANDFLVTVYLDKNAYRLHFSWNDRLRFWALGVRTDKNYPIVEGVRCVTNYPLLAQYRRPTLPGGRLICQAAGEKQATVGRDDFIAGRVKLIYMTEGESNGPV